MTADAHKWTVVATPPGGLTRERCAACGVERTGPWHEPGAYHYHEYYAPDGSALGETPPACVGAAS